MSELLDFFPDEDKVVVKVCNSCGYNFEQHLTECPICNSSNYYEDEI
jgi:rubrerythrin